jgi:hypothetical protein
MLMLRNGVPIGYVGVDTLFHCVDLSFNTFPTFRGGEAGYLFARTLAAMGPIFAPKSFTVEPYQLGHHNSEGIESGAWWFYYKLGFRPRDAQTRALARQELAKMKARPKHRSAPVTLQRLAENYLYFELPGARAPYWPRLADFGAAIAARLAAAPDANHQDAFDSCLDQISTSLGVRPPARASAAVRGAWCSWSVIASLIPGVHRWSAAERKALGQIISAKGGRRDSDYLKLFDGHPKLGHALRMATGA